jgi:hypothetical protein
MQPDGLTRQVFFFDPDGEGIRSRMFVYVRFLQFSSRVPLAD